MISRSRSGIKGTKSKPVYHLISNGWPVPANSWPSGQTVTTILLDVSLVKEPLTNKGPKGLNGLLLR